MQDKVIVILYLWVRRALGMFTLLIKIMLTGFSHTTVRYAYRCWLKNGDLYIAETDTIHVVKSIEEKLYRIKKSPPKFLFDLQKPCGILSQREHGWKWIDFGPDGALYISEGVPATFAMKMIQDTNNFKLKIIS